MSQKRVAFIGLGVMGYPMAGHLQAAGHDVCVYNRTAAKAERWVTEHKGRMAQTAADAAKDADFVFACVGNDDQLKTITIGATGAFSAMPQGAVFVDHTTASAELAKNLAVEAKSRGLSFIDAPVSGGQLGAEKGVLTVMAGGDPAAFEQAEPLIGAYAQAARLMGESGAGQLTKMVNQICVVGLVQGLAEGIHFAMRSGLDPKAVMQVLSKGAAQSWQMENRHEPMVDNHFDHGFTVDWMRKDLGIVLNEARHNGSQLPLTALIDQFFAEVQDEGGGKWDISSLIKRMEHKD